MPRFWTWPSEDILHAEKAVTPKYMRPAVTPIAVVAQEFLTAKQCKETCEALMEFEPYKSKHCGAVTRDIPEHPSLDAIEKLARSVNEFYFGFDLDAGQQSWMQTYATDDDYQRHSDGAPGQTRKLTAVAILSANHTYSGGWLRLYSAPKELTVPKLQGTIVVFPSWVEHDVEMVTDGVRQTINMGFWGPPFK